ncbi:MAG: hypothetical protein PHV82_16535 [Victivallaceae bacterium]|nr:hypothetical protein [Victivallaceae bacterium]
MNTKAMGLMVQIARGLLKHGECHTTEQLGDRSKYVGLSDIGKGAECLRAAVAGKVFGNMHPKADDVLKWYQKAEFDKVMEALRKQLILQRGHWFEAGIEKVFEANKAKFFTQLEIDAGFDGVPVLAHLDFVLVAKGAVRVLELKSTENLPDNLYASYETQIYGQLGFLSKYWNEKRFSIRDGTDKMTFPELVKQKFCIDMPESVQDIDLEGWVLCLSMSDAKAFGPYKANDTMTRFCEKTAKSIWEKAEEIRNNNLDLNSVEFCKGFHPLCEFCDHAGDCPKFTVHELGDSIYNDILTELEVLKSRKAKLAKDIAIAEDQIREFYVNSGVNGDWLSTGDWRFRFAETAGRKTLDTQALLGEVRELIGDDQVENLIQKHTSQGLPGQRLYVSKVKD